MPYTIVAAMKRWFEGHKHRHEQSRIPQVPDGSRIYAIGDIHGRADLLADLHRAILADAVNAPRRRVIIYLGDYVDRGMQSREVVKLLIDEALPGFEAVYLKGNHEAAMLDFLANPGIGPGWMQFGGMATLASYGVGLSRAATGLEGFAAVQKELTMNLPADHLVFLRNLELTHEEGDYYFVHAGVRPGVALSDQAEDDLIWIRDEFLDFRGDFGRVVVHGHTIADEPQVYENRIAIDTGAFATGRLTCLVLEGSERRFLST